MLPTAGERPASKSNHAPSITRRLIEQFCARSVLGRGRNPH
jgi:hypothetical protein